LESTVGFAIGLVLGAILLTGILILAFRASNAERKVTIRELPEVVAQLRQTGKDGSFAVFLFTPANETGGDSATVNLQYSIENAKLGFDWVLLAPRNLADRQKIWDFAKECHLEPTEREMNKVRYLRIEGGDVTDLGMRITKTLYGLTDDSPVDLIVESFAWPPKTT
jgi:hypothetical protein